MTADEFIKLPLTTIPFSPLRAGPMLIARGCIIRAFHFQFHREVYHVEVGEICC
jgi:hypothetical protein